MKRRAARELVLKVLFAWDLGKSDPYNILDQLCQEEEVDDGGREFTKKLVKGVLNNQEEIDAVLQKYSIEWDLKRMAAVDRNIMRIAFYEMGYTAGIPEAVAANEAIELAKSYGSKESARFINGILGTIIKDGAHKKVTPQRVVLEGVSQDDNSQNEERD